jgi:hypothetical protein
MALEAKRTLVKSAPELWAEISDVAALARHLGELGEIRITRAQPEELVEWEGDRASGTVRLEPSGWGTRVTLTAEPTPPPEEPTASAADAAAPEPAAITPEPATPEPAEPATHAAITPQPATPDPAGPATPSAVTPDPEPPGPSAITPEPAAPDPAPTPRTGIFARLFRRFRRSAPPAPAPAARDASVTDVPAEPHAALAEPDASRTVAAQPDEPGVDTAEPDVPYTVAAQPDEPGADTAEPDVRSTVAAQPDEPGVDTAEPDEPVTDAPVAGEPAGGPDDDTVLAILTGTLDRLGSAHHRPFSRG